ncbi:PIG-L family deacetylase [Nonomuraea sp. NPDC059194]|uniref:PIG-L family deacetylase n=1 Tax=Nonomuraea sp. NPDC059194 TaxID=3346764 RepID=UPI0036A71ECA
MRALSLVVAVALVLIPVAPFAVRPIRHLLGLPPPGERLVQVVAHPDDDLLFMSPDLFGGVIAGRPTMTVFLTAGEGTAGLDDGQDPHAYARQRQEGIRAAYAWLAGVPDRWRGRTVLVGRVPVRIERLVGRPRVRLVFVGLPDGGDPRADGGGHALSRLLSGATGCVRAFVSPGPCLSKADVIGMLAALLARFRPTELRTLDPSGTPAVHPDHPDHTASARFAKAAAAGLGVRVRSYRGYPITSLPPNLPAGAAWVKQAVFHVYRRHDYRARGGAKYRGWIARMYRTG